MDAAALADRLWVAIEDRTGMAALSDDVPELTVDSAYEIQDLVVSRHLEVSPLAAAKLLRGVAGLAKEPIVVFRRDQIE